MRKAISITTLLLILLASTSVAAHENIYGPYGEPFQIEATAYCDSENPTASGCKVREGICAGPREWMGKCVVVYSDLDNGPGELIGIYECLDTGGDLRIATGRCVDIWMPTEDECIEFGRQKVWVQVFNAKG